MVREILTLIFFACWLKNDDCDFVFVEEKEHIYAFYFNKKRNSSRSTLYTLICVIIDRKTLNIDEILSDLNCNYNCDHSSVFRIETPKNYFIRSPRVRFIPLNHDLIQCFHSKRMLPFASKDIFQFEKAWKTRINYYRHQIWSKSNGLKKTKSKDLSA